MRPHDLELTLKQVIPTGRKVYIFIDRNSFNNFALNQKVIEVAYKYEKIMRAEIKVCDENLGVARAVPAAINWICTLENRFIVLEDDCHLNDEGFNFFDLHANSLEEGISMLCGTSPWDISRYKKSSNIVTISNYPLIWGWATSKSNWIKDSVFIGRKPPYWSALKLVIRNPSKAKCVSFFLAAHIRVYRGSLKAWDSSLALGMLINKSISLVPDISLVTNTGRDKVASNTKPLKGQDSIYSRASDGKVGTTVIKSARAKNSTNRAIENYLLNMKARHLFSAVKAFIFG